MITKCKKCGSNNLYLEPRIAGQDILTADMVALKCKDCGSWLKWCPKNERVNYLKIEELDKWQKLKEWLDKCSNLKEKKTYMSFELIILIVKNKMRELEGEDDL